MKLVIDKSRHDQMGFIPTIKVTHRINRMKKQKSNGHVNRYRKSFQKFEHSFMIKKTKKKLSANQDKKGAFSTW